MKYLLIITLLFISCYTTPMERVQVVKEHFPNCQIKSIDNKYYYRFIVDSCGFIYDISLGTSNGSLKIYWCELLFKVECPSYQAEAQR